MLSALSMICLWNGINLQKVFSFWSWSWSRPFFCRDLMKPSVNEQRGIRCIQYYHYMIQWVYVLATSRIESIWLPSNSWTIRPVFFFSSYLCMSTEYGYWLIPGIWLKFLQSIAYRGLSAFLRILKTFYSTN